MQTLCDKFWGLRKTIDGTGKRIAYKRDMLHDGVHGK